MKKQIHTAFKTLLTVLALTGLFAQTAQAFTCTNGPTSPVGIQPAFVPGNPVLCTGGLRINDPSSGTYALGNGTVTITVNDYGCGPVFSWSVSGNITIDNIVVKGGPDANDYDYTGENPSPTADGGLHAPVNSSNGKYYGLSHIDFCYSYKLTVSKTANTSYTQTWNWTIDKVVSPGSWQFFDGDQGTSHYTVAVTKTGYTDSNWAISGSITVTNNTPFAATITSITDVLPCGPAPALSCGVTFPYTLPAGATLSCTYSASVPSACNGTNTVTVTTNNSNNVKGNTATAPVVFGAPTTVVNNSIDVSDSNGMSWSTSTSNSWTYPTTFDCGDEGQNTNIATIVQTGQSDDARVTVTCYDLLVRKTANTSYDRTWNWTIDKVANISNLTLMPGQVYPVIYTVSVTATSTDHNYAVNGTITIENNHPTRSALLATNVADVMTGGITATVVCPTNTVPANGQIQCTYTSALPNAMARTNTATATQQNYSFNGTGGQTPNGTTAYSGTANVAFSAMPTNEYNKGIIVEDLFDGQAAVTLGSPVANTSPQTFVYNYTNYAGPFEDPEDCGNQEVTNIARIPGGGSDTWTVNVTIPCNNGCTLTQGYWKTHSHYGPAPEDEGWFNLGSEGADKTFFLSGKTYYQVLWTPIPSQPSPKAYYQLAHQYIAAKLNVLNGASSPSDVSAAISWAENFFNTYTPNSSIPTNIRNQAQSRASLLDQYNNGLIGPGHCSEHNGGNAGEQSYSYLPEEMTEDIQLSANPNPFMGEVVFKLSVSYDSPVTLDVFNANGQKVATLFSGYLEAGQERTVSFDGTNAPQGLYLYRLTTDREVKSGQMISLK